MMRTLSASIRRYSSGLAGRASESAYPIHSYLQSCDHRERIELDAAKISRGLQSPTKQSDRRRPGEQDRDDIEAHLLPRSAASGGIIARDAQHVGPLLLPNGALRRSEFAALSGFHLHQRQ